MVEPEKSEDHICPKCHQKFKNGQGLGGHMSRVHQGQSVSYQRKIMVREGRTFDRLMFRCAKHFHDKKYNVADSADTSDMDRAFIRRWKTKIYKFLESDMKITLSNFGNYSEDHIFELVLKNLRE